MTLMTDSGPNPSQLERFLGEEVDDTFLVSEVRGGGTAGLRALMRRYDRLVRYTIFCASKNRCLRDPQWLDSIATDVWAGFVQSVQRGTDPVRSVPALLSIISRNKIVSALRSRPMAPLEDGVDSATAEDSWESKFPDPLETLERLDLLSALRDCVSRLDDEEKALMAELEAITSRNWHEAAGRLGIPESTLRSRWERVRKNLQKCLEKKVELKFARDVGCGD